MNKETQYIIKSFEATLSGQPWFGRAVYEILGEANESKVNTKPNGIIYIVTGAGGQGLYDTKQTLDTNSWQKFTAKFESRVHSYSLLDVNGNNLVLRQVDINGKEVDRIKITK